MLFNFSNRFFFSFSLKFQFIIFYISNVYYFMPAKSRLRAHYLNFKLIDIFLLVFNVKFIYYFFLDINNLKGKNEREKIIFSFSIF